MYTDVFIPTDGSDHVEPAIQYGLSLAHRYDATIHALHVVDSSPVERKLELTAAKANTEPLPDTWEGTGDTATRRIAKQASELNLETVTEVRRGIPAREIRSYIADNGIDLVCMGTRGNIGLDQLLCGGVTARIIRTVKVPVLGVRSDMMVALSGAPGAQFENILVPTDGGKLAQAAVTHALDLDKTYDASLHILNAIDQWSYASPPGNTLEELWQTIERSGEALLEKIRSQTADEGLSVITETLHASPYRSVETYCDQHNIDLIVMGTHGRSGLLQRIIGSVTERVLRGANVPVLTVRGV